MLRIYQAETDQDKALFHELSWEYLQWANARVYEEYGVSADIQSMLDEDLRDLDKFLPPCGRLLLAEYEGQVVGLACMKRIRKEIGEIKRMYVRSAYRRRGIGRALLEALIAEARDRLPTDAAGQHALYGRGPLPVQVGWISGDRALSRERDPGRAPAALDLYGTAIVRRTVLSPWPRT